MHKTRAEATAYADAFLPLLGAAPVAEIALAPPFPLLDCLGSALAGSPVSLCAQNVHDEAQGAYTGEVSAAMLLELGCQYAIVGHSERRALFGESSDFVARKARALLDAGIRPIVCIGETLDERESGDTERVISEQLRASLAGIAAAEIDALVVAYEPVWAIGTGKSATPAMAQEVHAHIRSELRALLGEGGKNVRIQYGGSVKPDNAALLLAETDIDGALVGGAGLEPDSFAAIVMAASASA